MAKRNRPDMTPYMREWRAKNPERFRKIQNKSRLKRKYGITKAQYDEMWVQQLAACALCDVRFNSSHLTRPAIDHDHKTGKVRGLLCFGCNTALGKFKENPAVLRRAAAYVED